MWYKLYFYAVIIFYVGMTIFGGKDASTGTLFFFIDVILTAFALVGLYGYLYRKSILTKKTWRTYAFIYIAWELVYMIYSVSLQPESTSSSVFALVAVLTIVIGGAMLLPLIIGLFKYSKIESKMINS